MSEAAETKRGEWRVRKTTLHAAEADDEAVEETAAEWIGMMWQLAVDAWVMMGKPAEKLVHE